MDGFELFTHYTSKRDYTGSPEDSYAQTLETLFVHLRDDLFPLLEKAELENKKLLIKETVSGPHDHYDLSNVI